MSFNIDAKKALVAEKSDERTAVHLHDERERPVFYGEGENRKPVVIYVLGAHSEAYRRIERAQNKRKIKPSKITMEGISDDVMERVVECTVGWDGLTGYIDGDPAKGERAIEFNRKNIIALYNALPFIYNQVHDAVHDPLRFFGSTSKPGSSTSDSDLD